MEEDNTEQLDPKAYYLILGGEIQALYNTVNDLSGAQGVTWAMVNPTQQTLGQVSKRRAALPQSATEAEKAPSKTNGTAKNA